MASVELIPAYEWTCDECGVSQFERAIVPDMTEEDRNEILESYGIDPAEIGEGELMLSPSSVCCNNCGAVFDAHSYGQLEEQ